MLVPECPKQRFAVCQIDSAPLVSDLRNWFEKARLLGRSPSAEAISYPLNNWEGLAVSSGSPARKIAFGLTLVAVLLRREIFRITIGSAHARAFDHGQVAAGFGKCTRELRGEPRVIRDKQISRHQRALGRHSGALSMMHKNSKATGSSRV